MTNDGMASRGDCLARGTRLATPEGARAVETLQPGDTLLLARGGHAPVLWVGRRRVDCRRHPHPHTVRPVRVARGAFAEGSPGRDLLLSPDHAVFANNVLIPVGFLLNGQTLVQMAVDSVEYFHVELCQHDVMLAEGLGVESYLDAGTRTAFDGATIRQLHPHFARAVWDSPGCLPLTVTGPAFQAVLRMLRARCRALRQSRMATSGN